MSWTHIEDSSHKKKKTNQRKNKNDKPEEKNVILEAVNDVGLNEYEIGNSLVILPKNYKKYKKKNKNLY